MSTRVLVVEDESGPRGALHEYFSMHGLDVRSTADGREAIEIGRRFRPQVLLCDWCLEGGPDGVVVAKTLSDALDDLAIVFMTGFPPKGLERICEELPVRAIFKKPLRLSEVKAEIEVISES